MSAVSPDPERKGKTSVPTAAQSSVSKAIRVVIYPLFGADEEATSVLLNKLADVMVEAHGKADDDTIRSILLLENTDEDAGSEEWISGLASRDVRCVLLPGASGEDES